MECRVDLGSWGKLHGLPPVGRHESVLRPVVIDTCLKASLYKLYRSAFGFAFSDRFWGISQSPYPLAACLLCYFVAPSGRYLEILGSFLFPLSYKGGRDVEKTLKPIVPQ